ncbi:thioredoxin-like domain-containing protein [Polaribacter tangerinus]|uniref:thioredoxin-like domain-containing protein n=1 Tax=Polaribacter tangerinus TaxID=1920034 RepID=UPI000B4ABF88|nr:thioredoxin-like domain-containing protein [Polaribacter tangerinus]
MTKFFLLIFIFLSLNFGYSQKKIPKTQSEISFQSDNFKNKKVYLVSYYGNYKMLQDSAIANNNGELSFKKNKKYTEGLYLLVNTNREIELEFLMDYEQRFRIKVDKQKGEAQQILNSPLNTDFQNLNIFSLEKNNKINLLKKKILTTQKFADRKNIYESIDILNHEINEYKNNYINNNNNTLSLFLKLSAPIDDFSSKPANRVLKSKKDSLLYLKENCFKGIDFSDERILVNPFLEKKITGYLDYLIAKNPKSITKEAISILEKSRQKDPENSNVFKYLSLYILNKYITPKQMGNDQVFVTLYEKYFKDKSHNWLQNSQKELFKKNYYFLKNNQIGKKGRNLYMSTKNKEPINLYDIKATFTILVFWDPNCEYCKVELPKLNTLYKKNWSKNDVKIFAINLKEKEYSAWQKFIKENNLNNWTNVFVPSNVSTKYSKEELNFQQHYNVTKTPIFYLLDRNKNIIAKDIDPKNYSQIMANYMQMN